MAEKTKKAQIFKRDNTWWSKNWFYTILIAVAVIGGVCAFWVVPFVVPQPFSKDDSISTLRQAVLVATGGVLAILTLWENRRKNDQEHMRQVHAERRARYAKAIEQLADEKAPIRLGGVYTLVKLVDEWLADEKTLPIEKERQEEGQVIINSLCAYIRSPFDLASKTEVLSQNETPENYEGGNQQFIKDQARFREEKELRLTILEAVRNRLNKGTRIHKNGTQKLLPGQWSGFEYDFSNTVFFYPVGFNNSYFDASSNFSGVKFTENANFYRAKFTEIADFSWAKFTENANFSKAKFTGDAHFSKAEFTRDADFFGAEFTRDADFSEAQFTKNADFFGAEFTNAHFSKAEFTNAHFSKAEFTNAHFSKAEFTNAHFSEAKFTKDTDFSRAKFTRDAHFSEAKFTQYANFYRAKFTQNANFSKAEFTNADFSEAEFTQNAKFFWAKFTQNANFSRAKFTQNANFAWVEFTQNANFFEATFEEKPKFELTLYNKPHKAKFSHRANPEDYNFKVSDNSRYKIETEEKEYNETKFIIPKGTELFDPDEPSEQDNNDGN